MDEAPHEPPPALPDVDDGRNGTTFLKAASAWAFGAGTMLLLPRQWVSAGIALGLALILWFVQRRRARKA